MSNTYWSTYVQTSEELYRSRALRFRPDNQAAWIGAMGVADGMDILEVGCGGGLFSHRIKAALPDTSVTGLDLDDAHVRYAAEMAGRLGLDCAFVPGDACSLPFEAGRFDLCFSHTVMNFCDPDLFAAEQYRVLKRGGHMVAMDVLNLGNTAERWVPSEENEEKHLFDRLWSAAKDNKLSQIARHTDSKRQWAKSMEGAGFGDIAFRALATMSYCPNSGEVSRALGREQINEDRLSALSSILKARRMAPGALTEQEFARLTTLIDSRYDRRLAQYECGDRLWDFGTTTVLCVIGTKRDS